MGIMQHRGPSGQLHQLCTCNACAPSSREYQKGRATNSAHSAASSSRQLVHSFKALFLSEVVYYIDKFKQLLKTQSFSAQQCIRCIKGLDTDVARFAFYPTFWFAYIYGDKPRCGSVCRTTAYHVGTGRYVRFSRLYLLTYLIYCSLLTILAILKNALS